MRSTVRAVHTISALAAKEQKPPALLLLVNVMESNRQKKGATWSASFNLWPIQTTKRLASEIFFVDENVRHCMCMLRLYRQAARDNTWRTNMAWAEAKLRTGRLGDKKSGHSAGLCRATRNSSIAITHMIAGFRHR